MKDLAIRNVYPNAVTINGETEVLDAQGNPIQVDWNLVDAEYNELKSAYDAQEYARKRAPEYPSIGDQLDALFKAGVFPADMAAQIQAVKDKYPKA